MGNINTILSEEIIRSGALQAHDRLISVVIAEPLSARFTGKYILQEQEQSDSDTDMDAEDSDTDMDADDIPIFIFKAYDDANKIIQFFPENNTLTMSDFSKGHYDDITYSEYSQLDIQSQKWKFASASLEFEMPEHVVKTAKDYATVELEFPKDTLLELDRYNGTYNFMGNYPILFRDRNRIDRMAYYKKGDITIEAKFRRNRNTDYIGEATITDGNGNKMFSLFNYGRIYVAVPLNRPFNGTVRVEGPLNDYVRQTVARKWYNSQGMPLLGNPKSIETIHEFLRARGIKTRHRRQKRRSAVKRRVRKKRQFRHL